MPRFFHSLSSLRQYLSEFRLQRPLTQCPHCQRSEHLIVHDTVHKKACGGRSLIVGRRLFCSNRGQRKGCGRTLRLSLANRIPSLFYSTQAVCLFLLALMESLSIHKAYEKATGQAQTRNAFRWLHRLEQHAADYRSRGQPTSGSPFQHSNNRRTHLIQSLTSFLTTPSKDICQRYQLRFQIQFM